MATFQLRGNRQWRAMIRRKGWPEQSRTFDTKADAERWARAIEGEMDRGIFVSRKEAESTTLGEALERYGKEVSALKKGAVQELSVVRMLSGSPLSRMFLAAIQGKDIAKYRDAMLADGYSPITIKRRLSVLSHLFTIATKEWGMEGLVNPVPLVSVQKPSNARDRRLVGDEEERLLDAAREYGEPLPSMIRFALETTLRRGALAAMLWKNVDIQTRVLFVPVPNSKNGESYRVPLSSQAISVLNAQPRRMDGKVWGIRADIITQAFDRACKRAGIEDLRFHDLRHESTSRLFEKGFNPMEVSTITGHKTLQMLKRYTHLRAEDLAKRMG